VLSYSQAALKALKVSAAILTIDSLGTMLFRNYLSPYAFFGDLLLIETSALFLIAGALDFGSSLTFTHLRRSMSLARETPDSSRRRDPERHALVMVSAGAILFIVLILLALLHSGA